MTDTKPIILPAAKEAVEASTVLQQFPLYSRVRIWGRFNKEHSGTYATVVGYTTFQTDVPALLIQKDVVDAEPLRWNPRHASLLADQYTVSFQHIPSCGMWKITYNDSIGTPCHSVLMSIRSDKHLEEELEQRGLVTGEITKNKQQLAWRHEQP